MLSFQELRVRKRWVGKVQKGKKIDIVANLINDLRESSLWPSVLLAENAIPSNLEEVRCFESKFKTQAVVVDGPDDGIVPRPRLWYTDLNLRHTQLRWG